MKPTGLGAAPGPQVPCRATRGCRTRQDAALAGKLGNIDTGTTWPPWQAYNAAPATSADATHTHTHTRWTFKERAQVATERPTCRAAG